MGAEKGLKKMKDMLVSTALWGSGFFVPGFCQFALRDSSVASCTRVHSLLRAQASREVSIPAQLSGSVGMGKVRGRKMDADC